MLTEIASFTTSGFGKLSLAKEDVAGHVQRLRQGPARFVMISDVHSTTEGLVLTEDEDTLDESWAWQSATGPPVHLRIADLAQQGQSLRILQRFWDSIGEQTQELSSHSIRFSTIAQTGPRPETERHSPEREEPPIWQLAAEVAGQVSDEDWAKVPRDLAINVDHYLYGTPKKKEDV